MAPAPSIHEFAQKLEAPTTRSNKIDASVGAAGMKERYLGWSPEMHAGPKTSSKIFSALSPPIPSLVMVCPARSLSVAASSGPSRGGGFIRTRFNAYWMLASAMAAVSSVKVCMRAPLNAFPGHRHYRCARPRVEEAWSAIFRAFGETATQVRPRSQGACRKQQAAA